METETRIMAHMMKQQGLTQERANNILNYFRGSEGYSGGGFFTSLMDTFAKGDDLNRQKLGKGFPAEYYTFVCVAEVDSGLNALRVVAAGEIDA